MSRRKPLECPACGHERIVSRPRQLQTETGHLRVRLERWICGLCGYQWSPQVKQGVVDGWEPV